MEVGPADGCVNYSQWNLNEIAQNVIDFANEELSSSPQIDPAYPELLKYIDLLACDGEDDSWEDWKRPASVTGKKGCEKPSYATNVSNSIGNYNNILGITRASTLSLPFS